MNFDLIKDYNWKINKKDKCIRAKHGIHNFCPLTAIYYSLTGKYIKCMNVIWFRYEIGRLAKMKQSTFEIILKAADNSYYGGKSEKTIKKYRKLLEDLCSKI